LFAVALVTLVTLVSGSAMSSAGVVATRGDGDTAATQGHEPVQPAPSAVAGYYPVAYTGEPILRSAVADTTNSTVTLPLHKGRMRDGRAVWYVLTDTSDRATAHKLGLNWSPKLANAPGRAVRTATLDEHGALVFDQGTVDFRPERTVVPGAAPNFFPPAEATPGSVGDRYYSPLVRVGNAGGAVFNATTIAFDVDAAQIEFPDGGVDHRRVLDRAVAISPAKGTVTLSMSLGTSGGRPVLFVSLDSNAELLSALEATTYAPALKNLPVGRNDRADSAVAVNFIIANGPTGSDNPQRQGLNSALGDPGAQVFDIFDGAPGVLNGRAYSPMWDLYVSAWTQEAIDRGYRSALHSELEVLGMAARGWLTAPGGGPVGPSGLISNCPLIMHF